MLVTPERIGEFRGHLLDEGIRDPAGTHHEFSQGMHGLKWDFDDIPDDSELFHEWVGISADFIVDNYEILPNVLLAIANGTNRVVRPVTEILGGGVIALETEKKPGSKSEIIIPPKARLIIAKLINPFVLKIDDVGTTGASIASAGLKVRKINPSAHLEALVTLKRSLTLPHLDKIDVPYKSIIDEPEEDYTKEDCEDHGYCADENQTLIPYKKPE